MGRATQGVLVGVAPGAEYGPTDLKHGESCQYCKAGGARVLLDENGAVRVDGAAAQKVLLQGGGKGLARLDDTAKAATATATWMGQVETYINALVPGTVSPLSSTFASTSIAVINSASTKTETG